MKKAKPLCIASAPLWKTVWGFLKKINVKIPFIPANPFLGIYPKEVKTDSNRYLYSTVYSNIFHNSQKIETTCQQMKG